MSKVLYARVPDDMHEYIMQIAAEQGTSMGDVIRKLILRAFRDEYFGPGKMLPRFIHDESLTSES